MTPTQTHRQTTRRTTPTIDDEDIHPATRDDYPNTEAIAKELPKQETRSALDDSNCCDGGDQGFRIYKTDLPRLRVDDLTPGLLIYRPTPNPLLAYELLSEPYTNEHGSNVIDVRIHSRSHADNNPEYRSRTTNVFVSMILNKMTALQPSTVQTTLTTT